MEWAGTIRYSNPTGDAGRRDVVDAAAHGPSDFSPTLCSPDGRLGDQATNGRKLRSLVANQRADGVSYSAGKGGRKKRWGLFSFSARLEQKGQLASS